MPSARPAWAAVGWAAAAGSLLVACAADDAPLLPPAPPSATQAVETETLRWWGRACLDDQAYASLSEAARRALPPRPQHDRMCRRYQAHLLRTPGIWGDTPMLMVLGLMTGVRVAVYAQAGPGDEGGVEAHFSQWLGSPTASVEVHLLNRQRLHWLAFYPAVPVRGDLRANTVVRGRAEEAGGGGDCMFYAFLRALEHAGGAPLDGHISRRDPRVKRMRDLRQALGDFLEAHWYWPVSALGGPHDDARTLGALAQMDEPREVDPLGP